MKQKIECIACGKIDLLQILDLNSQPLANSYHKGEELKEYPLGLNLCKNCYHLQLTHIVNPDELFKNYLYVSGTTKTLRDYFKWFAEWSISKVKQREKKVLDIACNDGSQLDAFKQLGWKTFGIDPAENLFSISSRKHTVVCEYFDASFFSEKFDIIIAQNVFAHTEKALEFLQNCEKLMHEDSLLFIQTSQAEMVKNNQFDTIYHEHISFFNVNSMLSLSKRSNLNLINVEKNDIHGISYIFTFSKFPKSYSNINQFLELEFNERLLNEETYLKYSINVNKIVSDLKIFIEYQQSKGIKVVGYGAAAKGMTLLNYGKIIPDLIVDDNKLKVGLYTPGSNIKIQEPYILREIKENIVILPLAWNFHKEIKQKVQIYRENYSDIWVKYFPKLEIL
jgi:SAM-dependent methyltransferase